MEGGERRQGGREEEGRQGGKERGRGRPDGEATSGSSLHWVLREGQCEQNRSQKTERNRGGRCFCPDTVSAEKMWRQRRRAKDWRRFTHADRDKKAKKVKGEGMGDVLEAIIWRKIWQRREEGASDKKRNKEVRGEFLRSSTQLPKASVWMCPPAVTVRWPHVDTKSLEKTPCLFLHCWL